MTPFQPFALEAYQSRWERTVEMNLADSSVQCLGTHEWLDPDEQQALLHTGLFYPEVNGTHLLRERIAALYPAATPAHVLVTVGAAQANQMVAQMLAGPGSEVVVLSPGYRQVWGVAVNAGATVHEVPLDGDHGWRLDVDALERLVTPRTRLVSVCNPNNPTGSILNEAEMARIVAACARVGAWLHADEVYHGTEHEGVDATPTFWGRYDRLICTNSLSKAYGLAGLRLGWIVAAPEVIEELWRRHEYAVIAAAAPSMAMAEMALAPAKRAWLFARQRTLTMDGWRLLQRWIAEQDGRFSVQPARATAIGFVRSHLAVDSVTLADRIREEGSVLVAPGSLLGAEHHLRITVGYPVDKVRKALERVGDVARKLARD